MKKYLFLLIVSTAVVFAGCSYITTEQNNSTSSSMSGDIPSEAIHYKILTGDEDITQQELQDIVKNLDDISIIQRGASYDDIGSQQHKEITHTSGDTTINIFLTGDKTTTRLGIKENGETLTQQQSGDDLATLLEGGENIQAIYGPYTSFTTEPVIVYTYTNQYSDAPQQKILSLDDYTTRKPEKTLLYHTKQNDKIFATTTQQDPQANHLFQDIFVSKSGARDMLSTGSFDGFGYDQYRLYAFRTTPGQEKERYEVNILNTTTPQDSISLTGLPLGPDATFFLDEDILYVSFGVVDFVTQQVEEHIIKYDTVNDKLLREILRQ